MTSDQCKLCGVNFAIFWHRHILNRGHCYSTSEVFSWIQSFPQNKSCCILIELSSQFSLLKAKCILPGSSTFAKVIWNLENIYIYYKKSRGHNFKVEALPGSWIRPSPPSGPQAVWPTRGWPTSPFPPLRLWCMNLHMMHRSMIFVSIMCI